MSKPRPIELLAPAKNKECGMEAIRHGADAVYIGAPCFSARAAAGNSIPDIAELTAFAHLYRAKVYVAFNTLLTDPELKEAEEMIRTLYQAGVDALIVQDMGITALDLPPLPLHASTQTDNRTPEKVDFLYKSGFRQIVLARELSLRQIRTIHEQCPQARLEVFVHGALCVSYSGQCYVSQAVFGRSANRGECAQFCRLPFDLKDADGRRIARHKHLLSLKDLNRTNELEALLQAGVSSLKIEGRLKDTGYVKNLTAWYRKKLDRIIAAHPQEYGRASSGTCTYTFEPDPEKSFNRGFTSYFLHGREKALYQPDTPKSLGEEIGRVKTIARNHLTVTGVRQFHNGDGAFYVTEDGTSGGFRVNRAEGNRLFPQEMPALKVRTRIFRNYDHEFEKILAAPSSERKIDIALTLRETPFGFALTLRDEDSTEISVAWSGKKEEARSPQREQIRKQLSKLGNTPFRAVKVAVECEHEWFLPSSSLAEGRRKAVEALLRARRLNFPKEDLLFRPTGHPYPETSLSYTGNVLNEGARRFYLNHGVHSVAWGFELEPPDEAVLMNSRHCLRYELGGCAKAGENKLPFREPFYLEYGEKRFRLTFDCKSCEMKLNKVE